MTKITKQKLILVEGKDEVGFFEALLRDHLERDDVAILDLAGKSKLDPSLKGLVREAAFRSVEAILVVRDADFPDPNQPGSTGYQIAWKHVCGALSANGIPAPTKHGEFMSGKPRVAIFLMPDGASDGMLEDLCRRSVTQDPASTHVGDYFKNLATCGINHKINVQSKAWMQAFLASRLEPVTSIGLAAKARYWNFDDPCFAALIELLKQM